MGEAVTTCPVCQGGATRRFLHRPSVPVHQNLVLADADAARRVARGELALRCCDDCGFVFNAAFDPALLGYGAAYDNRQDCSAVFQAHVDGLVADLLGRCGVRDCRIVEIGCGDGSFLRRLVADPEAGNTGYGFDPAYVGPDVDLDGRLRFERHYFDTSCAAIKADVAACRHVLEHVPDPLTLLGSVRRALTGSQRARVFFETPCVRWILEREVVWDLFYEHCSLFSVGSLTRAFETAGFRVDEVRHTFAGQYLWLEGRVSVDGANAVQDGAGDIPALAAKFAEADQRRREQWRERMHHAARTGPVASWGAGAKGATFANLVDPDCTAIACLVDINPNKQGKFVPGTGHPIVAPAELTGRGITTVMILNPNYRAEIERTVAEVGSHAAIVDMMDASE